ncbi:MAG: DegQ family serine endoprotease [Rhodospirillaceae bacterium]
MSSRSTRRVALGAVLALSVAAGAATLPDILNGSTALTSPAAAQVLAPQAGVGPQSFADVIDRVSPAVVSVETETRMDSPPMAQMQIPEPFRQFFGDEFMQRFGQGQGQGQGDEDEGNARPQRRAMGAGTGFIIDPAGFIVTNDHVIRDAETITVKLKSGERFKATVVGRDSKTDIALLKVDAGRTLPAVQFGDSDSARVGDWVISIGNPFGLGNTVTSGIISARGRSIGEGPYDDFLQIDAPINRGNSGGPTFNARGEVIGINTAIYSPTGGSVGIGFAIPSAMARDVVAQLKNDGKVERGWLGVTIQEVTPDIASGLGLKDAKGAVVAQVVPNGPARKADLKAGDVITAVDGKAIDSVRDLPRIIAKIDPGATAKLTVLRQGKEVTVSTEIGRMPQTDQVASAERSPGKADTAKALGMQLAQAEGGVAIVNVQPGSPAYERGLRKGDVILRVGNEAVSHPDQVVAGIERAKSAKREAVVMLVKHNDAERFVAVPVRAA